MEATSGSDRSDSLKQSQQMLRCRYPHALFCLRAMALHKTTTFGVLPIVPDDVIWFIFRMYMEIAPTYLAGSDNGLIVASRDIFLLADTADRYNSIPPFRILPPHLGTITSIGHGGNLVCIGTTRHLLVVDAARSEFVMSEYDLAGVISTISCCETFAVIIAGQPNKVCVWHSPGMRPLTGKPTMEDFRTIAVPGCPIKLIRADTSVLCLSSGTIYQWNLFNHTPIVSAREELKGVTDVANHYTRMAAIVNGFCYMMDTIIPGIVRANIKNVRACVCSSYHVMMVANNDGADHLYLADFPRVIGDVFTTIGGVCKISIGPVLSIGSRHLDVFVETSRGLFMCPPSDGFSIDDEYLWVTRVKQSDCVEIGPEDEY
jgi:hypothetical protein